MDAFEPREVDPDLAICDQEPLAFSGQIQDEGALLACDAAGVVSHYSDNLAEYFGGEASRGLRLHDLFSDDADYFVHRRRSIHDDRHYVIPNVITRSGREGDLLLSEHGGRLLYEFEPHQPPQTPSKARLSVQINPQSVPNEADIATLLQRIHSLTQFPKIMLYRFLEDSSGEVVAELSDGSLDDYLGLRFPASDIPRNARSLYVDNPFRLIFDTAGRNVPVQAIDGDHSAPLDLSTSTLRSVSPMHIEYLGNMGVRSSCSFSVRLMGKLWGLVALHAVEPTRIDVGNRIKVRELIDRQLSLRLMNARINAEHSRFNASIQRLEDCAAGLLALLRGEGEVPASELHSLIDCDNLLVLINGQPVLNEADLGEREWTGLGNLAQSQSLHGQFITESVSRFVEQDDNFRREVSGVLYQRIGAGRLENQVELFWLRREQATEVNWAGRPEKLRRLVDGEVRISPRQSFDKWTQQSLGQAQPWANSDNLVATKLAAQVVSELTGISRGRP